jgi:hypothetical protein
MEKPPPVQNGEKDCQQNTRPYWTRYELGTQNIGLIAGLAKACDKKRHAGMNGQILGKIRENGKTTSDIIPAFG